MNSYLEPFLSSLPTTHDTVLPYLIPSTLTTCPLTLYHNSQTFSNPPFDLIMRTFYSPHTHSHANILMRVVTDGTV
jgi:hypothetical protein